MHKVNDTFSNNQLSLSCLSVRRKKPLPQPIGQLWKTFLQAHGSTISQQSQETTPPQNTFQAWLIKLNDTQLHNLQLYWLIGTVPFSLFTLCTDYLYAPNCCCWQLVSICLADCQFLKIHCMIFLQSWVLYCYWISHSC